MQISLGAVSKPLESLKIKTGDWAVRIPRILEEKCIGCEECYLHCPEGCIVMVKVDNKKISSVDENYCKGCGICFSVCPADAIEMIERVIK